MIDFYELQNKVFEYIKAKFSEYLEEKGIEVPNDWTDEVLDLDKWKKNFTVFVDFNSYSFSELSTDSQNTTMTMDLYFVRRNADTKTLKQSLLNATSKFYSWFYDSDHCDRNFEGLVDWGIINEVNLYSAVSGSNNIQISQITIEVSTES